MRTLLVGYDLTAPGRDYRDLLKYLNATPIHWHCLDSTWLVKSDLTHAQLRDVLQPLVDLNDQLVVADVSGDPWAWTPSLPQNCRDWLNKNH